MGVAYHQVQKYEKGTNRISAGRLWRLAQIFDVPVTWFFEDIGRRGPKPKTDHDMTKRETLQFVRYYSACTPTVQKRIRKMIGVLVDV